MGSRSSTFRKSDSEAIGNVNNNCNGENPISKEPNSQKVYRMNKENHGLCLIINNETFEIEGKNRRGSSKDVKTLKKLFTELRYTIIVKKDVGRSELDDVLNNFAKNERHKNAEMCIVIIMSHGDNGAIETVDGRMYSPEDLFKKFNNSSCPNLQGVPKFFVLQTCRGDERDYGSPRSSCNIEKLIQADASPFKYAITSSDMSPSWEDMLILYSTMPRHESYRSPEDGSYLINEMDKTFREFAHFLDIKELLDEMSFSFKGITDPDLGRKQMPNYEVRGFYHKLYFKPNFKSDQSAIQNGRRLSLRSPGTDLS